VEYIWFKLVVKLKYVVIKYTDLNKFQRKRWFMLPWFVWGFLVFLSLVRIAFAIGGVLVTVLQSSNLAITLLVILTMLILGKIISKNDRHVFFCTCMYVLTCMSLCRFLHLKWFTTEMIYAQKDVFISPAIDGYLTMAVFCSFREIGVANAETPSRDISPVQFQPINRNRGGLV
jgi:hypothetical protein